MEKDLETRIREYILDPNHPERHSMASRVSGYIPETNKVQLTYKEKNKVILVDIEDLEKGYFDENTLTVNKPVEAASNQNVSMSTSEPFVNTNEPKESKNENINENNSANINETTNITLNDIKTLIELKNKDTLDNILKTIATTETGEVDINKIIGIVSNNFINETIDSVKENRILSTELYKYDKEGKLLVKEDVSSENVDLMVNENNGFNNLMVYIEAAKLYGVNYTDEQIQMAKQHFINSVNSKVNVTVTNVPNQDLPKVKTLTPPQNVEMDKAGFADVFILAVIVLVYAAIIVNLIMKLK